MGIDAGRLGLLGARLRLLNVKEVNVKASGRSDLKIAVKNDR